MAKVARIVVGVPLLLWALWTGTGCVSIVFYAVRFSPRGYFAKGGMYVLALAAWVLVYLIPFLYLSDNPSVRRYRLLFRAAFYAEMAILISLGLTPHWTARFFLHTVTNAIGRW